MDLSIGFFSDAHIMYVFFDIWLFFRTHEFHVLFILLDLIPNITIYRGFLDHRVCDVPPTLIQCLLSLPFNILVIIILRTIN